MGKSRYLLPWPLLIAASLLAVFTLTRAGLAVYAGPSAVPFSLWPWIFLKGLGFDLPVIMTAVAPVLFYEALLPASWQVQLLPGQEFYASLFINRSSNGPRQYRRQAHNR